MSRGGPGHVRRAAALVLVLAALVVSAGACGADDQPAGAALVPIGVGLRGPAGLRATMRAQGLSRVSALTFDGQGRLWAATSDNPDQGTDAVFLVPAPGRAPLRVISGLHTPLGLLWRDDRLYVASAGRVDAYRAFDGAAFAQHATILTVPAGTGELNEIVAGPDGRLLLGISAPCDHCTPTSRLSGSVVSFHPDGTDLQVFASGIRAPVGLAIHPRSKRLYVTMNQRDDLGSRTRGDWLATVERGQSFGFPGCYGQGGTPCAGVPKPAAVLDEHAAVSGVAIVAGQLGPTVGTSALVAEWATGKVQRVDVAKPDAKSTASATPLLTGCKNPVAVIVDPTGGLLVGDWTSGMIYRVARAS